MPIDVGFYEEIAKQMVLASIGVLLQKGKEPPYTLRDIKNNLEVPDRYKDSSGISRLLLLKMDSEGLIQVTEGGLVYPIGLEVPSSLLEEGGIGLLGDASKSVLNYLSSERDIPIGTFTGLTPAGLASPTHSLRIRGYIEDTGKKGKFRWALTSKGKKFLDE